ncbi:hypothetical protein LXL04_024692 [Taraxacum kok-saghyz]
MASYPWPPCRTLFGETICRRFDEFTPVIRVVPDILKALVCGVVERLSGFRGLRNSAGSETRRRRRDSGLMNPLQGRSKEGFGTSGFSLSRVQQGHDTPPLGFRKIEDFNGFKVTDTAHPYTKRGGGFLSADNRKQMFVLYNLTRQHHLKDTDII